MSDIEQVVALLSKVSDQVGTTAAAGLPYLVRYEYIQGWVLLSVAVMFVLVGVGCGLRAFRVNKDDSEILLGWTAISAFALFLGMLFITFGIPQVLEPTGSVIGYLLKHAVQ